MSLLSPTNVTHYAVIKLKHHVFTTERRERNRKRRNSYQRAGGESPPLFMLKMPGIIYVSFATSKFSISSIFINGLSIFARGRHSAFYSLCIDTFISTHIILTNCIILLHVDKILLTVMRKMPRTNILCYILNARVSLSSSLFLINQKHHFFTS